MIKVKLEICIPCPDARASMNLMFLGKKVKRVLFGVSNVPMYLVSALSVKNSKNQEKGYVCDNLERKYSF